MQPIAKDVTLRVRQCNPGFCYNNLSKACSCQSHLYDIRSCENGYFYAYVSAFASLPPSPSRTATITIMYCHHHHHHHILPPSPSPSHTATITITITYCHHHHHHHTLPPSPVHCSISLQEGIYAHVPIDNGIVKPDSFVSVPVSYLSCKRAPCLVQFNQLQEQCAEGRKGSI